VRVMLVDDRPLVRNGIASLLRAHGHEVVGEAADGGEALDIVGQASPDVVLMDIRMPGMGGPRGDPPHDGATPRGQNRDADGLRR
jgi:YesN/AraC family two-component response regulator